MITKRTGSSVPNSRPHYAPYMKEALAETEEEKKARKAKYCAHCKYGVRSTGHTGQSAKYYVTCNYSFLTGHSRGCSPIDCKRFEPGEPLKRKRGKRI